MEYCINCGADMTEDMTVCPECGFERIGKRPVPVAHQAEILKQALPLAGEAKKEEAREAAKAARFAPAVEPVPEPVAEPEPVVEAAPEPAPAFVPVEVKAAEPAPSEVVTPMMEEDDDEEDNPFIIPGFAPFASAPQPETVSEPVAEEPAVFAEPEEPSRPAADEFDDIAAAVAVTAPEEPAPAYEPEPAEPITPVFDPEPVSAPEPEMEPAFSAEPEYVPESEFEETPQDTPIPPMEATIRYNIEEIEAAEEEEDGDEPELTEVMSTGQYTGSILLMCIPVVGWLLTLIWAFGGTKNPNRRNMARGVLIVFLILLAVSVLFLFVATYVNAPWLSELYTKIYKLFA